jgi:hypothetical protein
VSKGNPHGVDAIRYGRGKITITGGDLANGYGTFEAIATTNDNSNNRWGLFQKQQGSYLHKGLLSFGSDATAVDFRDANRNIFIDETYRVSSSFNRYEVRNASSRVDWTAVSITALGIYANGEFAMVANANVNLTNCTFTDMATFTFQSNATVTGTTFRRCARVTQGGATFTNCTFDKTTDSSAILITNASKITNTKFISDGTGYAIEINVSSGYTHTLSNVTFSGYAASNGSTGNEAIYVGISSGTVTINISGGDVPSIRTTGATVNVVASATVELTGLKSGSEVRAYLGTNPATATEIDGVESSGTSFTFSQSYGGQAGYIVIFATGYKDILLPITYSGSNQSIPIQQQTDRVYSNP